MSRYQIEKAISISEMEKDSILFLDIQPGSSDLREEVLRLRPYLKIPKIHLNRS